MGLLMAVLAIIWLCLVAYFIQGSQELIPTAEQHEKVRMVTGVGAVFVMLLEYMLWRLWRRGEGT